MRRSRLGLLLICAAGLISCSRSDNRRAAPAARQLGKEAYQASQDAKRGAKEAAHQLRSAGKNFQQGWNEAKRQHDTRPQK
jgi:hypothetical protein